MPSDHLPIRAAQVRTNAAKGQVRQGLRHGTGELPRAVQHLCDLRWLRRDRKTETEGLKMKEMLGKSMITYGC